MKFSDLNIKKIDRPFEGQKISIDSILGKVIDIYDFQIMPSKKNDGTQFVKLQIVQRGSVKKEFICTSSRYIIEILSQLPQDIEVKRQILPLEDVVIKKSQGYYFEGAVNDTIEITPTAKQPTVQENVVVKQQMDTQQPMYQQPIAPQYQQPIAQQPQIIQPQNAGNNNILF